MSEHYYTSKPSAAHNIVEFSIAFHGKNYRFRSDTGVFSKREIDTGTELLISVLPVKPGDRVLDMGCGYGPIGIAAASLVGPKGHVTLIDINQRALELANYNLQLNNINNATVLASDGFSQLGVQAFDWIITNPPIRAGKKVIYQWLEQAPNHLKANGGFMAVIRKNHGAKSMATKLEEVFGNVETVKKNAGFRVLVATKQ